MGWFGFVSDDDSDANENIDQYPDDAHLQMYEEQPRVIPGGHYVVVVRVIEAKDLPSIKSFDLWQTVTSFSLKQATENADALPNVTTKVKLSRAGFPQQKRKTKVPIIIITRVNPP